MDGWGYINSIDGTGLKPSSKLGLLLIQNKHVLDWASVFHKRLVTKQSLREVFKAKGSLSSIFNARPEPEKIGPFNHH
jgi:hypothetical protein